MPCQSFFKKTLMAIRPFLSGVFYCGYLYAYLLHKYILLSPRKNIRHKDKILYGILYMQRMIP